MNSILFYCAVVLTLGGGIRLLKGRRSVDRGLGCVVIACGIGAIAAGMHAWIVLAVDVVLTGTLLISTLRLRRSDSSDTLEENPPPDSVGHLSGSPFRKGIALLISAAIGGILLSIIWSNPMWKIKFIAEREESAPGVGIGLIILLLLVIAALSLSRKKRPEHATGISTETNG